METRIELEGASHHYTAPKTTRIWGRCFFPLAAPR